VRGNKANRGGITKGRGQGIVAARPFTWRFFWFFTKPYLHPVFDRLLRIRYLHAPWQESLVMVWSGMRGAVSLAAALTVPLVTDIGDAFPVAT
jgi:CPA1 family monovalent cation:H+ antiporter